MSVSIGDSGYKFVRVEFIMHGCALYFAELAQAKTALAQSMAEVERLRADLAELRPSANPDAFVAATNQLGFNDADRQLLRDADVESADDMQVLSSDDFHGIGIHLEEKRHAQELRNSLGQVKLSGALITQLCTKAQSRKSGPSLASLWLQ